MRFVGRFCVGVKRLWCSVVIILAGCATQSAVQPDEILPMYGQPGMARSAEQQRHDEEFIKQAEANFSGSRERASTALWREGDAQMSRSNFDLAMKLYNQSWLLNPNNYQPYWGFGRVMAQREKPDEAIPHLEKSLQLIDDPYQKVALLSDMAMVYSRKAFYTPKENTKERGRWFQLANRNFEESTRMDSSYPNSWRGWARSLFMEGRYSEAWDKVKKARALGASFPPSFMKSLEEKMPEPK
ncbi:MAG TPA: hypothetical protein VFK88_06235 [Gallionella sp.]|nr:hypothetical protein [Gallionella sp.]